MRLLPAAIALLMLGLIFSSIAALFFKGGSLKTGELRCESPGAVIINIAGKDYAVNAIAGWQYPPVQLVWNKAAYPETNIDRLITRGLTLCERP